MLESSGVISIHGASFLLLLQFVPIAKGYGQINMGILEFFAVIFIVRGLYASSIEIEVKYSNIRVLLRCFELLWVPLSL